MKTFYLLLISGICALVSAAGPKGAQLKDGWYFIKNPESGKYLQVSAAKDASSAGNVVISTGTKDNGQKWKLTNVSNGLVTLTSSLGNYNIDVANGKDSNGNNIILYNSYGGEPQQFMILKTSQKNVYTIGTKVSNFDKAFDIENGRSTDGTNVLQWTNEMKPNQLWMFEKADGGDDAACWSTAQGYPCCSECQDPIYEDDDGKWGVEDNDWCGISTNC
ncbi:ricin B-like lectins [Neocallimastix lanati (nom. inval.)]|jgi:hypothetical protein|uniref:Ricin B-like lectin n=1 Tax=Neocallimastix californiae TaxID=1754190 RepID=A0A1Y2AF26_9FUNG|nr:ricin B-like lectins [Neocallimastix sp. JGI-2020a]ORY21072.1 ricin B-like lectin [Neocallimastix californiae]|eukprot:ORY21072.1 ricin B-like lectin [Neocallimastix californiae]